MRVSLFEYKMAELDRQVLATSVANRNLMTQRLRRLTAAIEQRSAPRKRLSEEGDLLFDNVPI